MKKKPYKKVFVGWMANKPFWSSDIHKDDPCLDIELYKLKPPKEYQIQEKKYRITIEEVVNEKA